MATASSAPAAAVLQSRPSRSACRAAAHGQRAAAAVQPSVLAASSPLLLRAGGAQTRQPAAAARRRLAVRTWALDAAQPFDYESQARRQLEQARAQEDRLKIGIVGFGNFGQFLAKRFVKQGHEVLATSRTDYTQLARDMNVRYFMDADDFVEEQPDVVILSTSIISMENVLQRFPTQRLRRSTLFVDVLSVKVFPKVLMLNLLPPTTDILCLHPMFGPESGKGSWQGLPLVFDRVRVGADAARERRCAAFLRAFETEGCRMVEMSCEEHDKLAASSQFITHTVGRMLGRMELPNTPINTRGYESLLSLVSNTNKDSFDLYYGLFMYNENATEELARLEAAFDDVKKQLFDALHDVVRARLFTVADGRGELREGGGAAGELPAGRGGEPLAAAAARPGGDGSAGGKQ